VLQPEVRDFEPEMALIAGPDGTEIAKRIIDAAATYLRPGGSLVVEMGIGQAEELRTYVTSTDRYLTTIEIVKDLAGIERVLIAQTK
jgi:release factor glutamine methyltransferase